MARIVIVDDNRDAADNLCTWLHMEGHQCAVAYDGVVALYLAASLRPDVVVLDLGMPVMDGYELTRRIRSESWGRLVHVVALTGLGQPADRTRGEQVGIDDYLLKPAEAAELLAAIARAGSTR